jgi:hypothetical protein
MNKEEILKHASSLREGEDEKFIINQVLSTSSDLVKASNYSEFCISIGGIEKAKEDHTQATLAWEQWCSDGSDSEF